MIESVEIEDVFLRGKKKLLRAGVEFSLEFDTGFDDPDRIEFEFGYLDIKELFKLTEDGPVEIDLYDLTAEELQDIKAMACTEVEEKIGWNLEDYMYS